VRMRGKSLGIWAVFTLLGACAPAHEDGPFMDHEESSDFEPVDDKADGVSATFNRHEIVSQALFDNVAAMDAATVQTFLEHTPYGRSSFLANEQAGGRPFSEAVIDVAIEFEVNPVLLLAHVQVERSLISRSTRPSNHAVDFARKRSHPLGCRIPAPKPDLAEQGTWSWSWSWSWS
jgi:hypothetical protein